MRIAFFASVLVAVTCLPFRSAQQTNNPQVSNAADAAGGASCKVRIPTQQAEVLRPVWRNVKQPALCSNLCRNRPRCNAWFWCGKGKGKHCWEPQTGTDVRERSCQLLNINLAPSRSPSLQDPQKPFSSWAAGFITPSEHRYVKYNKAPRLILSTAVRRCEGTNSTEANRLNWAALHNKLDFAHLHGHDIWVHGELGDRGKVEVLLGMLRAVPAGTWLLWADFDTMFSGRSFGLPLAQYEDEQRQLVMSGQLDEVVAGYGYKADSGTMLIKNSKWTRSLFRFVLKLLRDDDAVTEMKADLHNYHEEYEGRNERTALVWLVHKNPSRFAPQVRFETRFCLACFWEGQTPETSYITHFLMTQKCNQFSLALSSSYNPAFWKHVHVARCTFAEGVVWEAKTLNVLQSAQLEAHPNFTALRQSSTQQSVKSPAAVGSSGHHPDHHADVEPDMEADLDAESNHEQADTIPAGGPRIVGSSFSQSASTTGACRRACRQRATCNMWLYCWHPEGCDDGVATSAKRQLPSRGCQLLHLPKGAPYDILKRGPLFSSFSVGFFEPLHAHLAAESPREIGGVSSVSGTTKRSRDLASSKPSHGSRRGMRADFDDQSEPGRLGEMYDDTSFTEFSARDISAELPDAEDAEWVEDNGLHHDSARPKEVRNQEQHTADEGVDAGSPHSSTATASASATDATAAGSCYGDEHCQKHLLHQNHHHHQTQGKPVVAPYSQVAIPHTQQQQLQRRRLQQQQQQQQEQKDHGHEPSGRAARPNVALLTAAPPLPCKAPLADLLNSLSLANKVQYARIHGYELHFSSSNIEANVTGVFNKQAMLTKLLEESSEREVGWLWWLDIDTVIADLSLPLPLEEYVGRDLVAWGNPDSLKAGNMMKGINNGVLLVRNTDWSRGFWGEVSSHATTEGLESWRPQLEKELGPLPSGFFDTPIIVYLLKTRPKYFKRMFFELSNMGFNRHWMGIDWLEPPPLVVHYAGCTVCSPPESVLTEEQVGRCNDGFARAYAFASCVNQRLFLNDNVMCRYQASD